MEKLITAKELAQFLKLSESTIYKLASNGEIPGLKIGDSWRFDQQDIERMIRSVKRGSRNSRKETQTACVYTSIHERKEGGKMGDTFWGCSL
jgi:excisionase family DNA binding protein